MIVRAHWELGAANYIECWKIVGFMRSISRIECVMTCVRNMLNFVSYLIVLKPHLFRITKYDEYGKIIVQ